MLVAATAADFDAVLRINRAARPGVAVLEQADLAAIFASEGELLLWREAERCTGYVIVYEDKADYDGEEFGWFRASLHEPFLYIDQIAIAPEARGRGLGRRIYGVAASRAREQGKVGLACEVNLLPPNPGSLAFHARIGFAEVGRMGTRDGREVCLLACALAAMRTV
ncbi:GNAT family N-acetyltransferase [Arenimonas sp.]|uniref:GNAT family N-acetyltransferase n=1 Tax=Arenimonas sp. TaxID=1872635 RepID=UPI0039E324EF